MADRKRPPVQRRYAPSYLPEAKLKPVFPQELTKVQQYVAGKMPEPQGPRQATAFKPFADVMEERLPKVYPDPFIGHPKVVALGRLTMSPYITLMDACFVMYYKPCDFKSLKAKLQIRTAANETKNPQMHKYTTIDCEADEITCKRNRIFDLPTYQIYSHGNLIRTFEPCEVDTLKASDIVEAMEKIPSKYRR